MISFTNARCLSFDGVDDYVTSISGSGLTTFTIALWVKTTENGTSATFWQRKTLIGKANAGDSTDDFGITTNGGYIGFWSGLAVTDNSYLSTTTQINNNAWRHVVVSNNGTTATLYVDGSAEGGTLSTGGALNSESFKIGTRGGSEAGGTPAHSGLIDDVRIYNRALSATEITALANGTHTSATWDGDTSTNFETAGNWDTGAIPDPYTNITIANAGARPVCTANIQAASLTINSSASLDLSSYNLTLNDSGAFTNNGTLLLNGTQTLTNFTNDTDTGTEIIRGSTNLTGFPTGTTYNNLRIEDPTENGLVGYWKLDEGGGTSAADLSGNSNTGTLTNGPTYSTTVNSTTTYPNPYSLSFDGVNDYVSINDSNSLDLTSALTLSAWVKLDSITGYKVIIAKGDETANNNKYWLANLDGKVVYHWRDSSDTTDNIFSTNSAILSTGQWYNISISHVSGSTPTIYVNGASQPASVTAGSATNSLAANTTTLYIGEDGTGNRFYFPGLIDDVRIYNRALSTTEIANLAAGRYADGGSGTATHTFNGNVTVNGTLALDSGILSTSSYTNTVTGLASLYGGTYTCGSATQTFNGGLTVAGGTYTGGTGTSDVNGALTISAGTLTAPGSTSSLNVSGNFAHSGGTFTHNSGNVILDGNDQTISGATTFNNLTKTTSNTTLTFPASTTQTIAGTLTLQGASGLPISLRSSTNGTQWSIDPQGTRTVEYLDIKDSNNVNATAITATTAGTFTNSGNNTNWTFNQNPNAPTISSATIAGASAGTGGTYNVNYNQALVVNFTSTDPDASDTVTLSTPASPTVGTFTSAMAANPGTGSFTFTPGLSHIGMSYNFTVRATDNNSATSSSDLTVTINVGSNRPPTITPPQNITVDGRKDILTSIGASDPDGDAITYSASAGLPNGLTVNSQTGTVSGAIPCYSNGVTTYTITWQATDSNGASGTATSVISVACNSGGNSGGGGGSGSAPTTSFPKSPQTPPTPTPLPNSTSKPPIVIVPVQPTLPPGFQPIDISKFPKPSPSTPQIPIDTSNLPSVEAEFPKVPENIHPPQVLPSPGSSAPTPVPGNIEKVNVIFAGSPATFSLPINSEATKIIQDTAPSELDVLVTIIDANNKEYVINANVLISLVDNSIQITTDIIPEEVIEGSATLVLFVNNEPKAKMPVLVASSQKRGSSEIGKFKPIINSVKIKRKEDNLKLIISGANFFNTSESRTEVSMLPNTGLERLNVQILKGQKVMIVTYKIVDKNIKGKVNLSIVNSFGQMIKTIEIPREDGVTKLTIDEKKKGSL